MIPQNPRDGFGMYFTRKRYVPEALPVFEHGNLPSPVLDAEPGLVEMYWFCWDVASKNLRSPAPGSPLVSNWLDAAFSGNIFQWDTCFMMMFGRYGHWQFPSIQSLDNFYCRQRASGYICREIRSHDGTEVMFGHHGGFDDPAGWANTINPPLFGWAECDSFKVSGDKSRFAAVLPVLETYAEWLNRDGDPGAKPEDWEANGRRSAGTPHQLYWNTPLGCGMDNTPKPAEKGAGWVDMSSQMAMQYNALARICRELGLSSKAAAFEAEAQMIAERINRWCWNEEDGFYYDVLADGTQFKKKTSCGFWPMIAGVASKAQAKRLVAHLKDEREFWRPFVFPTLSADEPEYRPDGDYWVGAVWAPTNYAIIKGLELYGEEDFATEASLRYVRAMFEVYKTTGTVWENYAPESMSQGTPAKPDFVGWSGIGPITLLIENVLGFRPDGVRKHLAWRLVRHDRHGIERLRFGTVQADLLYDGKGSASVRTNEPFTLTLNGIEHKLAKGEHKLAATPP